MSGSRLIALWLALITLVVYLPVTRHDFICYDDEAYVTGNPVVTQGLTLGGVAWAFKTFYQANWHPLTWLSHMADCEFFNLNAGAHHFINALIHAANTALLFLLLRRLTGLNQPAAIVAALFAWHPLHVESVAWVAERKDVLSTCFGLLALLSYARFAREKRPRSYALALVFYVLSLLAKPMLVTLPFVLLLLDLWPLKRISDFRFQISDLKKLLLEKTPFFVLSAASCVVTFRAQNAGQSVIALGVLPLRDRLENTVFCIERYLQKIFWPTDLAIIYPYGVSSEMALVMAAGLLVFISAIVWHARHRNACWLVGWLWFLGTLVPVIGLVQIGRASMADRYTYLPAIGIFIAVVFGSYDLCGRRPGPRKILISVFSLLLILCVLITERQLSCWQNSETLFRHAIQVTENNEIAHDNLGWTFQRQGRNAEALAEYRESLRINPRHAEVHRAAADVLIGMGRPAEALAEYRACLSQAPHWPEVHIAAGNTLVVLGNYDAALAEFATAAQLAPRNAQPHLERAKIYFRQGLDSDAERELRAAVHAQPRDFRTLAVVAHYLAANENAAARDETNALILALKADELSGHMQPMVMDILGMAYAANGDFTNAMACARSALELASAAQMKNTGPLQSRLELYQTRQPWRESFRATNAPEKE